MARPTKFTSLQSTDPVLNRIQTNLGKQVNPVLKQKILNGALLTNVALSTTATPVPHKLGRKYAGFWVAGASANATVYQLDFAAPVQAQSVINLVASAPVTVNLWVF
jgi:hypothetical protein